MLQYPIMRVTNKKNAIFNITTAVLSDFLLSYLLHITQPFVINRLFKFLFVCNFIYILLYFFQNVIRILFNIDYILYYTV